MKKWKIILGIIFVLIVILFFLRLVLPKELDDVSPLIECDDEMIDNVDVLWVIPKFDGKSVLEFDNWCEKISGLGKEIGMHGVNHEYKEFEIIRDEEYLKNGIDIFEKCFGLKPKKFKPPQLEINRDNNKLIYEKGMDLKLGFNQFFHKVYHCRDTGIFPNWMISIF